MLIAVAWWYFRWTIPLALIVFLLNPVAGVFQNWVKAGLVELPTLVTIVLTIVAVEVPINLILHRTLHEGKLIEPSLKVVGTDRNAYQSLPIVEEGIDSLQLVVYNEGSTGAEECEAELTVEAVSDDFVSDYQEIQHRRIMWGDQKTDVPIRVGQPRRITVARAVKSETGAYSRIEFPSEKGWTSPIVAQG